MKKKAIIAIVAIALVACLIVAGTIAWLTVTSEPVKNVFVSGSDLDVTLDETTGDDGEYSMAPGATLDKDPIITVKEGSVACYLFFKAEESDNLSDFIDYTVATGWTALTDVDGVYYQLTTEAESDEEYHILADDQVTVKESVTLEMLDALTDTTNPTLTFTAYAIQADGMEDAADAWANLNPADDD